MRTACCLTLLILAPLALTAQEQAPIPKPGELNKYVSKAIQSFPTDGTHRYNWPKDGSYHGVSEDLHYRGEQVAKGNAKGDTYCCGLTFEVFLKAYEMWCEKKAHPFIIGDLSPEDLRRLRSDWYCVGGRRGPVDALVERGLGVHIDKPKDIRPGDFVQLWRKSGSGHSVIFLDWARSSSGRVIGLKYWSTQRSTKGIGVNTEYFEGKSGVKLDELYVARVGAP